MSAIDEALAVGIKVTIWLFRIMFELSWKLGSIIFYWVSQKTQPSPETKLIEQKTTYELGQVIESHPCPECETHNEKGDLVCYACGTDLVTLTAQTDTGWDWQDTLKTFQPVLGLVGGLVGVGLMCFACLACSALSN